MDNTTRGAGHPKEHDARTNASNEQAPGKRTSGKSGAQGLTSARPASGSQGFDHELQRLSRQLKSLSMLCQRLQVENQSLREHTQSLIDERARLIEKNDTARGKVEQMIVRLKALESST